MRWPGDKIKRLSRSRLNASDSGMSRSFSRDLQNYQNRVKSDDFAPKREKSLLGNVL